MLVAERTRGKKRAKKRKIKDKEKKKDIHHLSFIIFIYSSLFSAWSGGCWNNWVGGGERGERASGGEGEWGELVSGSGGG